MNDPSLPPIENWAICLRLSAGLHRILFGQRAGTGAVATMYVEMTTMDLERLVSVMDQAAKTQEAATIANVVVMAAGDKIPRQVSLTIGASQCEKMLPRLREHLQKFYQRTARKCSEVERTDFGEYSPS